MDFGNSIERNILKQLAKAEWEWGKMELVGDKSTNSRKVTRVVRHSRELAHRLES